MSKKTKHGSTKNFFGDFFGHNGGRPQGPGVGPGVGGQQSSQPQNVDNSRLYKIIGVEKTATDKEIRKAFLKASARGAYRHPDKGGDE